MLLALSVPTIAGAGAEDPLIEAVKRTDTAGVRTLLEQGADVTVKNGVGNTPLHIAVSVHATAPNDDGVGAAEVAQLLLASGADAKASNDCGETALHVCRDSTMAQLLTGAHADAGAGTSAKTEQRMPFDDYRDDPHGYVLNTVGEPGIRVFIGVYAICVAFLLPRLWSESEITRAPNWLTNFVEISNDALLFVNILWRSCFVLYQAISGFFICYFMLATVGAHLHFWIIRLWQDIGNTWAKVYIPLMLLDLPRVWSESEIARPPYPSLISNLSDNALLIVNVVWRPCFVLFHGVFWYYVLRAVFVCLVTAAVRVYAATASWLANMWLHCYVMDG